MTASAKSLFRATKAKRARGPALLEVEESRKPEEARRDLDYYPTGQPEAIRALLARDGDRIRALGAVWEPACGAGDLCREIEAFGLRCLASDVVDRGWPGASIQSFYDFGHAPAPAIITNPPYDQINARDGRGRWLRHTLAMPGWRYCALLLSWDWPAARANGLGAMLDAQPFTRACLLRFKIDFTGEGSPPQRNAWFVWDRDDPRDADNPPDFCWLNKQTVHPDQSAFSFGEADE